MVLPQRLESWSETVGEVECLTSAMAEHQCMVEAFGTTPAQVTFDWMTIEFAQVGAWLVMDALRVNAQFSTWSSG